MYRAAVTRHITTIKKLKTKASVGELPRIFETKIPLASKTADATEFEVEGINTLRQKYGWSGTNSYEAFLWLTEELLQYV